MFLSFQGFFSFSVFGVMVVHFLGYVCGASLLNLEFDLLFTNFTSLDQDNVALSFSL